MKAISLWQPWATWVALGWKTIETRTHMRFISLIGSRVAIHAAKRWDLRWCRSAVYLSAERYDETCENVLHWPRGAIVCTAHVKWFGELFPENGFRALCDTSKDKLFGLGLEDIRPLPKAIPFKGERGIFNVPDDLFTGTDHGHGHGERSER